MTEAYIDRATRDYWRRVRAALVFLEGIPTEELEGTTFKRMLEKAGVDMETLRQRNAG